MQLNSAHMGVADPRGLDLRVHKLGDAAYLGNAAQLSSATVCLEHEDAQHSKDDHGVEVGGGEGGLQTPTDRIQDHPHGNQNAQSCRAQSEWRAGQKI